MRASQESFLASANLSQLERIEPVCVAFETAWLAGEQPKIEKYLGSVEAADQNLLLRELLLVELEYRSASGETPNSEYSPSRCCTRSRVMAKMPTSTSGESSDMNVW